MPRLKKKETQEPLELVSMPCSVTLFNMHFTVSRDGRERGLWFMLSDDSEKLNKTFEKWFEQATTGMFERLRIPNEEKLQFLLSFRSEVGHLLPTKIREAALLEWPEVKKILSIVAEEVKKHEE